MFRLIVPGLLLRTGVGGDQVESGAVQDVQGEAAACFGPLFVLFGQDGTDETGGGTAVGKTATTSVRRRVFLFSRALEVLDQI